MRLVVQINYKVELIDIMTEYICEHLWDAFDFVETYLEHMNHRPIDDLLYTKAKNVEVVF